MGGGYSQQGYRPPRPPTNWGPPGPPPMQQPAYGYMQPGAYPGQPPQYTQSSYGSYPSQPAAPGGYSSGYDQSSNASTQQTTPGAGYDYYNQQQPQQQPLGTSSAPADATSYNYGQPAAYGSQGSYADASYSQASTGQQQAYGQETYNAQQPQAGVSQPTQNAQTGYDQGYGYGGTAVNPAQDGSAPSQQGYAASQPPSSAPAQKPPAVQTQAAVYAQPGAALSGYGQPAYAQAYGQQAPGYGGYGQQQAYGSGGYPQPPPAYSSEGGTAPAVPGGGVTKASPQS